jgi:hypothetical protein
VRTFTQDDIFAAPTRRLADRCLRFFWFEDMLANSGIDAGFYTLHEDNSADQAVLQAALPWLEDPAYQLVLVHLDQVDYAGHHQVDLRIPVGMLPPRAWMPCWRK